MSVDPLFDSNATSTGNPLTTSDSPGLGSLFETALSVLVGNTTSETSSFTEGA